MAENAQVAAPAADRMVTDYSTLPAGYVEYLQAKMDEAADRRERLAERWDRLMPSKSSN